MTLRWRGELPGETIYTKTPGWVLEFVGRKKATPLIRLERRSGPWLCGDFTPYAKSANKALCGGSCDRAALDNKIVSCYNVTCNGWFLVQAVHLDRPVDAFAPEMFTAHSLPILYLRACPFRHADDASRWARVELPC